ncbi:MAG: NADH-quinone oxidoreductase subunit L [Actinomycetes bacterium]
MNKSSMLDYIWLVPALPLFGAALLLLFGKRIGEPIAGWIATALMFGSFVVSIFMFVALRGLPSGEHAHTVKLFDWFASGGFKVSMGFLADPLSVTWILFVTGIATLIHLYSIGYMHGDARFSRFFAYLNLFVASMLILVLGSNFLVTFLGWEGVGLCSYLLISFWFERNSAAVAGKKAFVTTRVGDFGFMIAMFLLFASLGTLDYAAVGEKIGGLSGGTVTAIALLLFLGAIGKSAQIPLHFWLPDAMEGPTPVSALIHAATMVTAGIFIVARAHPIFEASQAAQDVVMWVGAITALLAATVALVQTDIKRVLAYSTVSQLGYMFLALGVGAYTAAIGLVVAHAFFKAALFLGSGSVIHGLDENQDIRTMGRLRKYMPLTGFGFIVAWLAIAGLPPFAGFWAKDEVLAKAFFHGDYAVWLIGVVAAILTAFYMTRETFLVWFGNERFAAVSAETEIDGEISHADSSSDSHAESHEAGMISTESPTVAYGTEPAPARLTHAPHEAPATMTIPVLILAALAAIDGLIILPFRGFEYLTQFLEPVFETVKPIEAPSFAAGFALTTLAVVIAVTGVLIGRGMYRNGLEDPADDPLDRRLGGMGRLFGNAYYFDAVLARCVDGPIRRFAEWIANTVDQGIIDGAVNGVASGVASISSGVRRAQGGVVRQYALVVFAGAAALLIFALVRS